MVRKRALDSGKRERERERRSERPQLMKELKNLKQRKSQKVKTSGTLLSCVQPLIWLKLCAEVRQRVCDKQLSHGTFCKRPSDSFHHRDKDHMKVWIENQITSLQLLRLPLLDLP